MKACTKCRIEKSLDDFGCDRRRRDGRQSACRQCHRLANKRWRESHPEYFRRWYLAHREDELAKQKAAREADPEAFREKRRLNYQRNPDPQRTRSREYRKSHPEYLLTVREWHQANPERVRELSRKSENKRRARKKALPYEDVDPQVVFERDDGICGICGKPVDPGAWHLDHVIPLAQGGPHTYANVQTAHPFCNLSKGGRGHERLGAFP